MAGNTSSVGPIPDAGMPKVPSSCVAVTAEVLVRPIVQAALGVHEIACNLQDAYEHLLQAMVFPRPINDKKAALSFQRTLEAYETYPILRVIWKESPYVTDSELEASGYMRSFRPGTLTCHGFAERIAESDTDVGKVNKRIRTIVDASSAYGLIEKQKVGLRKKNLLVGSEFLHEFMVELSKMHERILDGKRGSVLTEVNQS